MSKVSLNDWETMHIRKEIEAIHRSVTKKDIVDYAFVVDTILVLLGFAFDKGVLEDGSKQNISWWFFGSAIALLLLIFGCIIIRAIRAKKKENLRRKVKSSREIVRLIDDKVCYFLMTAQSMYDNGIGISTPIDRFYLIETSYYLNKCVSILMSVNNNISCVLVSGSSADDLLSGKISKERMKNIFSLLDTLYEGIAEAIIQCAEKDRKKISETIEANNFFMNELARIKKTCEC